VVHNLTSLLKDVHVWKAR